MVKQERKNTMKLLIIRHGDPDYTIDSLTEKGHREAEMLAERIAPMDIAAYYQQRLWTGSMSLTAALLSDRTVSAALPGICCLRTGRLFPNTTTKRNGQTFLLWLKQICVTVSPMYKTDLILYLLNTDMKETAITIMSFVRMKTLLHCSAISESSVLCSDIFSVSHQCCSGTALLQLLPQ